MYSTQTYHLRAWICPSHMVSSVARLTLLTVARLLFDLPIWTRFVSRASFCRLLRYLVYVAY